MGRSRRTARYALAAAVLAAGTVLVACQPIKPVNPPGPPHGTRTFSCVGHLENFFVPDGVNEITVDAFGAQGGPATDGTPGGLGGGLRGTLGVNGGGVGVVVQVTVGCQPPAATSFGGGFQAAPGGFNGGGPGGAALGIPGLVNAGGGGGGASVVRVANSGQIVFAGGGGGGGGSSPDLCIGGFGGGSDAGDGGTCGANMEGGGARSEPFRVFFGKGGTAHGPCCPRPEDGTDGGFGTGGTGGAVTCESPDGCHSGAGGGGGEAGGGGGGAANAGAPTSGGGGGGGGAGNTPSGTGMTAGVRAGGGEVVLTW